MTFTLKCGDRYSLVGISLMLLLLLPSVEVFAHAGHGDEFKHDQSSQPTGTIAIDQTTAERIGLTVEPVTRQSLGFGIQATGQIETSPSRRVEVTNPVGGTVLQLLVEPGDTVEIGQPLAVITSGELAELRVTALENSAERQGEIQQAAADLRLAQQTYKRQQQIALMTINQVQTELRVAQEQYDRDRELTEQGALPRRELLASEAHLAVAQQAVTEAESQLEVLEAKTEMERAQTALEVAQSRTQLSAETYQTRLQQLGADENPDGTVTIRAPISGTIADRAVTLGQSTEDAGATLMTIVDDRTVLATAHIYEKDLSQVSVGQRVRVSVSGLPDRFFEGRITAIGSVVEGESRVIPARAELNNGDGVLKPGMFAELEVLTDRTPAPVIAIPPSAIVEANGQPMVFVQNGDTFQPVEVTLGRQAGDWVEVKSGLFEGDRIVTQRANQLYAQSLRGGSTPADSEEIAEATDGNRTGTLPWWVVLSGSGGLAIATFTAGAFWADHHSRQQLNAVIHPIEHLEAPQNGHHSLDNTTHEPMLVSTEGFQSESEA